MLPSHDTVGGRKADCEPGLTLRVRYISQNVAYQKLAHGTAASIRTRPRFSGSSHAGRPEKHFTTQSRGQGTRIWTFSTRLNCQQRHYARQCKTRPHLKFYALNLGKSWIRGPTGNNTNKVMAG